MYTYRYIYIHMYIYICTCPYILNVYMYVYIHICIHTQHIDMVPDTVPQRSRSASRLLQESLETT